MCILPEMVGGGVSIENIGLSDPGSKLYMSLSSHFLSHLCSISMNSSIPEEDMVRTNLDQDFKFSVCGVDADEGGPVRYHDSLRLFFYWQCS